MRSAVLATALVMTGFLSVALAADEVSDSARAASDAPTPGIDVRTLIAAVSQKTHKKFLIDPRVMATVRLEGIGPRDVTYPLLLTILEVHGFAVYEQEGVIVVTPDANERFFPSNMVKPDDIRAPDAEVVTTILTVKNAKAIELVTILRPLVPTNGQMNALADRNALVIVDRAANVRRMVTMVHELEKLPAFKAE